MNREARRSDRPNPTALQYLAASVHLVPLRHIAVLAFLENISNGAVMAAIGEQANALVDTAGAEMPDAPAFLDACEQAIDEVRRRLETEPHDMRGCEPTRVFLP